MSTPTITLPAVGTYAIDTAGSTITGKTKAMFGLMPVKATFAFTGGELVVADPPANSTAHASVASASFDSSNAKRDTHIASKDFLDAENFPQIDFVATGITESGGSWVVKGDLTVHGTKAPVELTVTSLTTTGDALTVVSSTTIDRHAFGVSKMKGMAGGTIALEITTRAVRS